MKQKHIYAIIAVLSMLCIIFAVIIYVENIQLSKHQQDFCSAITGTHGCETVQSSKYSKVFGISNSIYGMVGFAILEVFALMLLFGERRKTKSNKSNIYPNLTIIKYMTILGGIMSGLVALVFLYLQILVIHAYCIFCLFVDGSSLIILGFTIYSIIKMTKIKEISRK